MFFQFADCHLIVDRRELRRGRVPVAIRPLPLDVLVHLVQSRDRLVTKDDLARVVWKRGDVSDQAIARTVADVRRAIGDDGSEQRLIRTIHGWGYRFVGEVVVSVDGEALAVDEAAPTSAWSAVESLRRAAEHVSRELASLPDERRAVLRLMAVMGRRFERTALLRAADDPGSRLPRGIVLDTFDDALRCGLIEAEAAASDQYRFTHEVVRTLVMNGRHP